MFNGTPTNASSGTMQQFTSAAHEILDLDNGSHHASLPSVSESEEGTKLESAAESPTEPFGGKSSGDSNVSQRGTPSDVVGDDKGADEGDMQAAESGLKNSLGAIDRVRHSLSKVTDPELAASMKLVLDTQATLQKHVSTMATSNRNLVKHVEELNNEVRERKANEQKHELKEQLVRLRAEGYATGLLRSVQARAHSCRC